MDKQKLISETKDCCLGRARGNDLVSIKTLLQWVSGCIERHNPWNPWPAEKPEKEGYYLIHFQGCDDVVRWDGEYWHLPSQDCLTHWQPLPAPPKEGK